MVHLSPSSPLDKGTFKALWKSSSPRRVNILIWIMAFGLLNCSLIMQRNTLNKCLEPLMCPLCMKDSEDLLHLFIICPYSTICWGSIFSLFDVAWAFNGSLSSNVFQLLRGPVISKRPRLIWENVLKALLAEIWFGHNQRIFHDKARGRTDTVDTAKRNVAAWCSLNKELTSIPFKIYV